FADAKTLEWRDNQAQQPVPLLRRNLRVRVPVATPIKRAWVASPDFQQGKPQAIPFTQTAGQLTVTVPQLRYWDMLVLE
ncbi:MAG: cycloisomaltooligosaccharide glucanotransferase, partial [Hymenobacter sp.]